MKTPETGDHLYRPRKIALRAISWLKVSVSGVFENPIKLNPDFSAGTLIDAGTLPETSMETEEADLII
ncbi:MAG: hypothetical protein BWY32_03540 [bacterium ADurb.Bin243]|nr:MAG: hypothetical protein BWY32_03540 [bacterium ADurb.Bin243]